MMMVNTVRRFRQELKSDSRKPGHREGEGLGGRHRVRGTTLHWRRR